MENETFEQVCAEMRSFEDVPPPMFAWRDLAERAEAAHKCELASKDAEIAKRKNAMSHYEKLITDAKSLIEQRNALIKELADALYEEISQFDDADAVGIAFPTKRNNEAEIRALVARAQKMIQ